MRKFLKIFRDFREKFFSKNSANFCIKSAVKNRTKKSQNSQFLRFLQKSQIFAACRSFAKILLKFFALQKIFAKTPVHSEIFRKFWKSVLFQNFQACTPDPVRVFRKFLKFSEIFWKNVRPSVSFAKTDRGNALQGRRPKKPHTKHILNPRPLRSFSPRAKNYAMKGSFCRKAKTASASSFLQKLQIFAKTAKIAQSLLCAKRLNLPENSGMRQKSHFLCDF